MLQELGIYRHSGRLGNGVITIPVVGVVAAALLGVVYSYAVVYIPIAGYVSFILTGGFAALLGFLLGKSGVWGKCRSTAFLVIVGLLVSLLALYVAWVAFAHALVGRSESAGTAPTMLDWLLNPGALWKFVLVVNKEGWYELSSGSGPTGAFLWVFWGLEALIIIGGATLISLGTFSGKVFCERCDRWCVPTDKSLLLTIPEDEQVLERLTQGDLATVQAQQIAPDGTPPHLRVDVQRCLNCPDTATYQVSLVHLEVKDKKKGEMKEATKELTENILLTGTQLQQLEARIAAQSEPTSEGDSEGSVPDVAEDTR
jgi:hypothetical protein